MNLRSVEKPGKVNSRCWAVLPGPCNPPPFPHLSRRATVIEPSAHVHGEILGPEDRLQQTVRRMRRAWVFETIFKSLYLNYACFTANLCLGMRMRQSSVTRPAISKREAGRVRQIRRLGRVGPSSVRPANGDPPNVGRSHAHPLISSDRWKRKGGTWVQPITCREQKRRIKRTQKEARGVAREWERRAGGRGF